MSDYATLQADVKSAMGRTDIPSYVYRLATATINQECRLLEMQAETTLSAAASVALPSDFLEMESVYIDVSNSRRALMPTTEQTQAQTHSNTGMPRTYAIHDGELTLSPGPDDTYTLTVRYYARLSDLSAGVDTNDVLTRHPALYLYAALTHAAVWAKDSEAAGVYAQMFQGEVARAKKADVSRRMGPTLRPQVVRGF